MLLNLLIGIVLIWFLSKPIMVILDTIIDYFKGK